jgi:hypothetical protein
MSGQQLLLRLSHARRTRNRYLDLLLILLGAALAFLFLPAAVDAGL